MGSSDGGWIMVEVGWLGGDGVLVFIGFGDGLDVGVEKGGVFGLLVGWL